MEVISLFDGMGCGRIALDRCGFKPTKYLAAEIDAPAIRVCRANWGDVTHIGNVKNINRYNGGKADLLLGGSPCQTFSKAGDGTGFDGKSGLFYEYVRIKNELNPTYFLLENVPMRKAWQDVISEQLGVEPILIDSALVSGQTRKRLYWTNIPNITPLQDKGIKLVDCLDKGLNPRLFHSTKALYYMSRKVKDGRTHWDFAHHSDSSHDKARTLVQNLYKGVPYNVLIDKRESLFGSPIIRKFSPEECERLQTVPVGYTSGVSNTQRYRMVGNGWTVDVIAHILSHIDPLFL